MSLVTHIDTCKVYIVYTHGILMTYTHVTNDILVSLKYALMTYIHVTHGTLVPQLHVGHDIHGCH